MKKEEREAARRATFKKEKRCQRCGKKDARTRRGRSVCGECNAKIMSYQGTKPGRKVGRPRKYSVE